MSSILVPSTTTDYFWSVPKLNDHFTLGQGYVDGGMNYDVTSITSDIKSTIIASRAVKSGANAGFSDVYVYTLYTTSNNYYLSLTKIDKDNTSFFIGEKQFSQFYLAGQPNNRSSFDGRKVKDFYVEDNGRVLHIIYAESTTVWYDIYEYDSSGTFGVNWTPINTYTVNSNLRQNKTYWRFAPDNKSVITYNVVSGNAEYQIIKLRDGDHTHMTLNPIATYTCTEGVESYTVNGIVVNNDCTQFMLFGDDVYSYYNVTNVDTSNVLTCNKTLVKDDRLPLTHYMQWIDRNQLLAISQESAPLIRTMIMRDAYSDVSGWVIGPGGDGSIARTLTNSRGQSVQVGGSGGDGGQVNSFDWSFIKRNQTVQINIENNRTTVVGNGQTVTALKGNDGTANDSNTVPNTGIRFNGTPGRGLLSTHTFTSNTTGGLGRQLDIKPFDGATDQYTYGAGGGPGGLGGGQSGSSGGALGTNENAKDGENGRVGHGDGGGGGAYNTPFGTPGKGGSGAVAIKVNKHKIGQITGEHTISTHDNYSIIFWTSSGSYTV